MFGVRNSWRRDYKLRPNVEAYNALYSAGLSATSFVASASGWATPTLGMFTGGCLLGLSGLYASFAVENFSYVNGLWKTVPFYIDTQNMPGDSNRLYLGRGFKWTPDHTQRLYDIQNAEQENQSFAAPPKVYKYVRQFEKWAERLHLKPLVKAVREPWFLNPYPHLPIVDEDPRNPLGWPFLHGVGKRDYDFYIPFASLNSHVLVLGTTRVGKTRSAEVMVTQDIRYHKNCSVIMIDPKGDVELALRMYMEAKRSGKADKFYFFHLAYPELSCRYNGVADFNRITEVATRITSPLADGGNSKVFKDFAWLFINTTQKAVYKMGKLATYEHTKLYLSDPEALASDYVESLNNQDLNDLIVAIEDTLDLQKVPNQDKGKSKRTLAIKAIIQQPPESMRDEILHDEVLNSIAKVLQYEKSHYDKISSSAGPHLEKMTTGQVSELISPNYDDETDPRPILDLRKVIREGGIAYIGLDAQTDKTVASAVGNSYLSELLSVSGEIYNHGVDQGIVTLNQAKPRKSALVRLHVDEANEVFGDEFNPILNKAGGSGVMVTAYTQSVSDIEVRLGDRAKANQALGNFSTLIVFRVEGSDTSQYLEDRMPQVRVLSVNTDSRVNDGTGSNADGQFRSSNGDTINYESVPLIPAVAFNQLPKGQCFVRAKSNWYKVKMPLFQPEPDMPANVYEMMRDLESHIGYRVTKDLPRAA
ncbi:conjugative transfer system coupling protein TraD [Vibrio cholerae]|nr:conjugative transfer system coupling protein TraD [Vibrio cholerae]EKF9501290.1 conjugative transfer system coupling protein TraD [Vibrio cholerae]ELH0870552.1 conjugative transfer system coupling protein TraD [Vibrio cholerae]HCT5077617.1 conjugative transfer system coupling protein TraD [Vibrio cholerae]HEJ2447581.1 conjugative transfer system coupling protein TraD [Vibrio cholerae]